MSLPDQAPKLPKTWFLVSDAVLLVTAALIARFAAHPFSPGPLIAIVACVATGALLACLPFLADYARKQDEALDQRQRSLEALAATVNNATEQLSIAASSLHQIAELAQRNLKHAEHLPQRLQEKINDFTARLDQAQEEEREELEKELASLRASETEKLENVSDQIHKSVTEFARLEATVNKHLTAARVEFIERTNEALARVTAATATPLTDAVNAAVQSFRTAQQNAVAELDQQLATVCASHVKRTIAELDRHLAASIAPTTSARPPEPVAPSAVEPATPPASEPAPATELSPPPPAPEPLEVASTAATPAAEEPTTTTSPAADSPDSPPATIVTATPPPEPPAAEAPAPTEPATSPDGDDPAKPARKRAPRKPRAAEAPLDLGLESATAIDHAPAAETTYAADAPAADQSLPLEQVESSLSSDGATRLLVTAYIGIGNKLFLRGDGPGLSRDKGVPLQFVSIGKWRWETNDAVAPIRGRLYKNDELECSALGEFSVEPGHQKEVSATF